MRKLSLPQVVRWIERSTMQLSTATATQGLTAHGFAVDSRLVKPQDLFFALPGARSDGHNHLEEVAKKGAVAAVVHKSYKGPGFGLALIKVNDVLASLQGLAAHALAQSKTKVVGITGSVGKTTTKDFISTILREQFYIASSPGNNNSQVGLPLTILNHMRGDEDFAVLEMGMTHSGNIANLISIAPPHVALLNNIELVHIGNFASLNDIAREKASIFAHPKTAHAIISEEIAHYPQVLQTGNCPKTRFSIQSTNADYYVYETPTNIMVRYKGTAYKLPLSPVPGQHILHNIAAAITVAHALQMDWETISRAIPKLTMPVKRMERIEKNGVLFVNDSYNASPISVKAALSSLPFPKKGGKRIAVLGDMMELGNFSAQCHYEVGEVALRNVDRVLCFGEYCHPILDCWHKAKKPAALFTELPELVKELQKHIQEGDVVLLKGSNSKGLWRVLDALETH